MNLRNVLLGTTAMLGAAAIVVPSAASAFEVNIRGFYNFNTVVGDLEESGGAGADPMDYDFTTDSEIHVQGTNTDDETGIRYGFMVEFETDAVTSNNNNIDENWIFIDGGFGGFRLGNEDGALDNSKIGAYNIAAGTGGIDGQDVVASTQFAPLNSGDATKIRYDSPSIAGFTIHGSYTPAGSDQGNNEAQDGNENLQDWVETALVYTASFGGLDLQAGGALGFASGENGADDYLGYNVGAIVGFSGFRVAGSYWDEQDRPDQIAGQPVPPAALGSADRTGITAGAAATLGPVDLSLTYASIIDSDDNAEGDNLVLSGSMGLLPGLSLHGDVSMFDRDLGGNDDGVTGVVRLRVAF